MVVLDVAYIFDTCGGAQALAELLQRHNESAPAISTVQMWKHRNSISGEWIVPVIYTLTKEGHELFTLMTDSALS